MSDKYEDEVSGSPVVLPNLSGWTAFPPSLTNVTLGNGTLTGFYKLDGDSMDFRIDFVYGSTSAVTGTILAGTPNGAIIDVAKLPSTLSNLGDAFAINAGATSRNDASLVFNTTTQLSIQGQGATGPWNASVPFTWATGAAFSIRANGVPIVGQSQSLAYGAGLATSVKPGLVSYEYLKVRTGTSVNGATTTPSINVVQSRVGPQVVLTIPAAGSLTKNASAGALTFNIDAEFWPASTRYMTAYGEVATASVNVLWTISPAGVVSMLKTIGGNTFNAAETGCGWTLPVTLGYTVA